MPGHKFNLGLTYEKKGDFTTWALLRYAGSSYSDEKNTIVDSKGYRWKKDGYYVIDISLVKLFHFKEWYLKDVVLTVAIDNLFNKHYQKGFFGRDEGRIVRGELALRF